MRVLVIGGGPSGLVTLKTLRDASTKEKPLEPVLLEATDSVGGTFEWRRYESSYLVSSKQLTCFSDFRLPLSSPDHISLAEYVQYLRDYIAHFKLDSEVGWDGEPRIRLCSRVTELSRGENGEGWIVKYVQTKKGKGGLSDREFFEGETSKEYILECDSVAICTGLHVSPSIPYIKGIENVKPFNGYSEPIMMHSSEYRESSIFKGRKVMILGCGETSMDLGYDAVKADAKEVVICHRGGFLSFPKVLNDFQVFGYKFQGNLPIDGLITNLFETAYVHPWVAKTHVRWFVSDFVIKRVLWFLTGTMAGCNQWIGDLPNERLGRAYVFLNKSAKAMPYINVPYKPRFRFLSTFLGTHYVDPPDDSEPGKFIDLAPWPDYIDETGKVHFSSCRDGYLEAKRMKSPSVNFRPDVVIYATGYKQDFSWLKAAGLDIEKEGGLETYANVRNVCKRGKEKELAWIGFLRPGVGAIPPMAEQQAQFWALLLQDRIPVPTTEDYYHLLTSKKARIQYGVDYSTYMSTIAKDMGTAPSLTELLTVYGFKVTLIYCFGAAFVTFYRLTGPFKFDGAKEIVETEILETIQRRGLAGNLFMGVIPMAFYAVVNAFAYLLEIFWNVGMKIAGNGDNGKVMKNTKIE